MQGKNIRLLIFDFDGTLASTKSIYLKTIYEIVNKHGYKATSKEVREVIGIELRELLRILGVKRKDTWKIGAEIDRIVLRKAVKLRACPDISSARRILKDYHTTVVSNSLLSFLTPFLNKHKIEFEVVIGAGRFKNKLQAFRYLFKKFRIQGKEAAYIADRAQDVKIAKAAGCRMIAVSNNYSWSSFSELKKEKPDVIIKSLHELESALANLD